MRLSEAQKDYVRNAEPNGALVRFGDLWGLVWQVGKNEGAPRTMWFGRLVKEVRKPNNTEAARFIAAGCALNDLDWIITWIGETFTGKRRRDVVEQLSAEALR